METQQLIQEKSFAAQGKLLTKALGVPVELADQTRTHLAILLLVRSNRVVVKKRLNMEQHDALRPLMTELRPIIYEIFKDNNLKQRLGFFREPLIHFLWDRFRKVKRQEILRYLDDLDSPEQRGDGLSLPGIKPVIK